MIRTRAAQLVPGLVIALAAPVLLQGALQGCLAAGVSAQGEEGGIPDEAPFRPFDPEAFVQWAKDRGASDAALQSYRDDAAEIGAARAGDELVQAILPDFASAVTKAQAGDPAAAVALAALLAGAAKDDQVLRGHARYHLGRLLFDGDDPEGAIEVFQEFLADDHGATPLDSEIVYWFAQALAEIPEPGQAAVMFKAYLQWYPDAPERFRATADQRLQEFMSQADSPLHGMADEMKRLTRDFRNKKMGKLQQDIQLEIIEQLDKIIREMEKQSSGGGPPSGNGIPNGPAGQSALPEGESRVGSLNRVTKVADRWGRMKDADREKIEAEMNDKLPPQYKRLLEQYYKSLGKSGGQ